MRSELWVCGLAHTDHRRGRRRVHRDTDRQQLRLLVRGRRLHHACWHEGLIGFSGFARGFQRLRNSIMPGAIIARAPRGSGRDAFATSYSATKTCKYWIAWPKSAGIQ